MRLSFLLQMLSNSQSNFTVSVKLYFRLTCIFKTYSAIVVLVKAYQQHQHIQEDSASAILSHILSATHSIQVGSRLFRTPTCLGTSCFRHIHPYSQRQTIEAHLSTFRYISADSGIIRILVELNMFIYIKTYSEPMVQAY